MAIHLAEQAAFGWFQLKVSFAEPSEHLTQLV